MKNDTPIDGNAVTVTPNGKVSENLADSQIMASESSIKLTITEYLDYQNTLDHDVRELPIWALPTDLQSVVEDVTKGYRSSRNFSVSSLMCATACVVGKRVTAHHGQFTNHATLWLMIVANSGRGKSPTMQFFFEPIQEMEDEANEHYQKEMQQWRANKCEGEEPIYRRRLIGTTTEEKVLTVLAQVGDVCWLNDEMRTTIESWGLYKNGANGVAVGNLLSIFGNTSTSIDRVGYQMRVKKPNLSIFGSTTPSVLKKMMGKKGYEEDGMFQRFLYDFLEQGKRPPRTEHIIRDDSKEIWRKYVKQLTSTSFPDLYETTEAMKLHDDVLKRWDTQADEYEEQGVIAMSSYLDKLDYHLCRWCACVAVLRGDKIIGGDVMRYSIECMEYFKWCAERAFRLIVNNGTRAKDLTNGDLLRVLADRFPSLNQSALAKVIGKSQQYVNRELNKD